MAQRGKLGLGLYPAPRGQLGGLLQPAAQLGMTGFTRANMSKVLAAMAATKANTADTRIGSIGDSTTAGVGASGTSWNGNRILAYPVRMAVALQAAGVPAICAGIFGKAAAATNFPAYISPDTITEGANWTSGGLGGMGGECIASCGSGVTVETYVFATAAAGLRMTIWQYTAASPISCQVSFDGGATWVGPLGADGNAGMQIVTAINPGAASTTIQVRRITGSIVIQAIEPLETIGTKKLRIVNAGEGSTTTATWTASVNPYDVGNQYFRQNLHLAIINLTINDRASIADPTAPMARLATMCANLKAANTDVLLVVPNPGNNSTVPVLTAYRNAIIAQAAASGAACLDLMNPLSTLANWQAPTNYMFDGIHPNAVGYDYIGGMRLAPAVQALWAVA